MKRRAPEVVYYLSSFLLSYVLAKILDKLLAGINLPLLSDLPFFSVYIITSTFILVFFYFLLRGIRDVFTIFRLGLYNKRYYQTGVYTPGRNKEKHIKEKFLELVKQADEIDILCISGESFLHDETEKCVLDMIHQKVREHSLRILLLSPESPYLIERAYEISNKTEEVIKYVKDSYASIHKLCDMFKGCIFFYDSKPIYRIIRFNDAMYVSIYPLHREGHQTVVKAYKKPPDSASKTAFDRTYYNAFRAIFRDLYNHRIPVKVVKKSPTKREILSRMNSYLKVEKERNRVVG